MKTFAPPACGLLEGHANYEDRIMVGRMEAGNRDLSSFHPKSDPLTARDTLRMWRGGPVPEGADFDGVTASSQDSLP